MNNKERFLTALRKGTPDKVPMFDLEFNEASIINIGKYFSDDLPPLKPMLDYSPEEVQQLSHVFFKLVEGLDLDAVNFVYTAGSHRLIDSTEYFKDDMGVVYRLSEHGDPFPCSKHGAAEERN